MSELRDHLCDLFLDIKDGNVDHKPAKEMNNAAGKVIASVAVELKAAELANTQPNIAFLKS
jgi:hypothetical protein